MTIFRRGRKERDLKEEIEAHLAIEAELRRERGDSPEEARAGARRDFGNIALVAETTRRVWWPRLFDLVEQDLRYAVRSGLRTLRREWGVGLVTILTLAFALGANTVIVSGINALFLKTTRLSIGHPRDLVDFGRKDSSEFVDFFSFEEFQTFGARRDVFVGVAALGFPQTTGVHVDAGPVEVADVAPVTGNYFDVMEMAPAAGRLFTSRDDRANAEPVAVVSYRFWQSRLAGRPDAIGRRIRVGTSTFAIVGVEPRVDGGRPFAPDIWLPLATHPRAAMFKQPNVTILSLVGRVLPGMPISQAQAAMDAVPRPAGSTAAPVRLGHDIFLQSVKPIIAMMMFGALTLLLIACANVAGIALARASVRRQEIALRLALGASRTRVVGQLIAEASTAFAIAGVLAVAIAPAVARLLSAEVEMDLSPDPWVFAFTFGLTLVAALLSGALPALQATRVDPGSALKDNALTTTYRRLRLRNVLVTGQIALSLVLVISSGLFVQTLRRLSMDPGFDPRRVQVIALDLKVGEVSEVDGERFAADLVHRVAAMNGVDAASLAWGVPVMTGQFTSPVLVPGVRPAGTKADDEGIPVAQNGVMPGYFRTLGIPIVRGRDFTDDDHAGPADQRSELIMDWSADEGGVAIVSESLAGRLWPGKDPIGQRYYACGTVVETCAVEVVGVAADARTNSANPSRHVPVAYRPFAQSYMPQVFMIVRGENAALFLPTIRKMVDDLNHEVPVLSAQSLDDAIAEKVSMYGLGGAIAGILGGLGLLLASLGIYGVVSYSVASRRREIGIRTALGARPARVVRLFLLEGARMTMVGVVLGCAAAVAVAHLIASAISGITAIDISTYAASVVVVAAIAAIACYLPARHAARSDPLEALRHE